MKSNISKFLLSFLCFFIIGAIFVFILYPLFSDEQNQAIGGVTVSILYSTSLISSLLILNKKASK